MTTPALNDDLVRRLRLVGAALEFGPDDAATAQEAAAALEVQAKEIAELKLGLEMIRTEARTSNSPFGRSDMKALRDIAEICDYALAEGAR